MPYLTNEQMLADSRAFAVTILEACYVKEYSPNDSVAIVLSALSEVLAQINGGTANVIEQLRDIADVMENELFKKAPLH